MRSAKPRSCSQRDPLRTQWRASRRAFNLIEMLIAMSISAMLLTATLASLDTSFKNYKATTESASTHVVARIVMQRLLAMIRTGTDFGPFPNDPYDVSQNPVITDYLEFVSERDANGVPTKIMRVEYRASKNGSVKNELWHVLLNPNNGAPIILDERPLLTNVQQAVFTLHYNEQTLLLDRASIDLTIAANDSVDLMVGGDTVPQTIRLVASAAPRQTN